VPASVCERERAVNKYGMIGIETPIAAMSATQTNALIFGIISLSFGVLILLVPRVLNYVIAIYLIAIGIVGIARGFS
jgi:uncharacterized membrane protein HdeD (DUF308 family)